MLVVSALIRARSGECAIGVEPVEFGKAVIAVPKMDPQTPGQVAAESRRRLPRPLALDSARQYGLVTGGPVIDVDRCWELLARGRAKGFVPGHSFSSRRRSDDCRPARTDGPPPSRGTPVERIAVELSRPKTLSTTMAAFSDFGRCLAIVAMVASIVLLAVVVELLTNGKGRR